MQVLEDRATPSSLPSGADREIMFEIVKQNRYLLPKPVNPDADAIRFLPSCSYKGSLSLSSDQRYNQFDLLPAEGLRELGSQGPWIQHAIDEWSDEER